MEKNLEQASFDPKVLDLVDKQTEVLKANQEAFLSGFIELCKDKKVIPMGGLFQTDDMRVMFQIGVKIGAQLMLDELNTK